MGKKSAQKVATDWLVDRYLFPVECGGCGRHTQFMYRPPGGGLAQCANCWNAVYAEEAQAQQRRYLAEHPDIPGGPEDAE